MSCTALFILRHSCGLCSWFSSSTALWSCSPLMLSSRFTKRRLERSTKLADMARDCSKFSTRCGHPAGTNKTSPETNIMYRLTEMSNNCTGFLSSTRAWGTFPVTCVLNTSMKCRTQSQCAKWTSSLLWWTVLLISQSFPVFVPSTRVSTQWSAHLVGGCTPVVWPDWAAGVA